MKERLTPGASEDANWGDVEATEEAARIHAVPLITPGTYVVFLKPDGKHVVLNCGNQIQACILVGKYVQKHGPHSWHITTITEVMSNILEKDKSAIRMAEKNERARLAKQSGGMT